jgi:hypothetical protein
MERQTALMKGIAIAGTALAGAPILLTIITGIAATIAEGRLLVDYMMPAELFLISLAGGLLLLWPALRTRQMRAPVIAGAVSMCVFIAACQGIALLSGIATGEAAAAGTAWIAVLTALALYTTAVIGTCIAGIVLTKRLFQKPHLN